MAWIFRLPRDQRCIFRTDKLCLAAESSSHSKSVSRGRRTPLTTHRRAQSADRTVHTSGPVSAGLSYGLRRRPGLGAWSSTPRLGHSVNNHLFTNRKQLLVINSLTTYILLVHPHLLLIN